MRGKKKGINRVLIIAVGLFLCTSGIFLLNSCIFGDGVGVGPKGDYDGSVFHEKLCDSTNPEHICYQCDPTDPASECYCDTTNEDHYLNPDSSCFCNPTIATNPCYDSCWQDTSVIPNVVQLKNICESSGSCDPTDKTDTCYKCTEAEKKDVWDTLCWDSLPTVDYETQIQPIWETNACLTCHFLGGSGFTATFYSPPNPDDGLSLKAGENPLKRMVNKLVAYKPEEPPRWRVLPYYPESSYLYTILTEGKAPNRPMPQTGNPLSADDRNLIKKWIAEGACESLNTCESQNYNKE